MTAANLTRLGPLALAAGANDSHEFSACAGEGVVRLQQRGAGGIRLLLNGEPIRVPDDDASEIAVSLQPANTLTVSTAAERGGGATTLRVTQQVEADLGLQRQGYFGLNTCDMARQREFYKVLGFRGEIYPAGPETSTSFARSLGFEDDYLIYVSLHSLIDPPEMPFVDTVQFRGDSFRDEPPYAALNHLGMTYATYATTDLERDYDFLRARGVEFLSAPATAADGERFVFLREPDGAFWKLIQEGEPGAAAKTPNFTRLVNTNVNVADLERSREFYRLLGFTESLPRSLQAAGEVAAAHGFTQPIEFSGEDVSLGAGTDGATLQLRQWRTPFDPAPPYAPPVNHLGIDRINFYVDDLTATIETMTQLGFRQLGPIGGWPQLGIVFFFDPDGVKVQFAGPQSDA